MSETHDNIELNELLDHTDWVRAIARGLVGNPSEVEDLIQESWLEVIRRPPASRRNLRAWLRQVVTNRARQMGRGDSRRKLREQKGAKTEATPSISEIAERAARHRQVVDLVLGLEEPFRSTVLLRFFEDLSAPQIADRLDVPLKTVHSRIARAFEKLRVQLDRDYGEREVWCVALMPLLEPRGISTAAASGTVMTTAGILAMNANMKVGIAIGAAILGGLGIWKMGAEPAAAPASLPGQEARLSPTSGSKDREGLASLDDREARRPLAESGVEEAQHAAESSDELASAEFVSIRGRLVDVDGQPIEGQSIALSNSAGEDLGSSGAGGRFEVDVPLPLSGCLRVLSDDWVVIRQSCVKETNLDYEHIVVAAPIESLEGFVEDVDGAPIADAKITSSPMGDTFYGFPFALDLTSFVSQGASSEAQGRFRIERFPKARGMRLVVTAAGFETTGVVLDEQEWPLVISMKREGASSGGALKGIVLDEFGSPVEGATVGLGEAKTMSDETGSFRLGLGSFDDDTDLCAGKAGSLPVVLVDFGARIAEQGGQPKPIELILGSAPKSIRGRVLDESGAACQGWIVSIVDETVVSQYRIPVDSAEALARGNTKKVMTDAEGRFELSGLYPRDYTIQAYEQRTLFRAEQRFTAGDEQVELRVSRAVCERLTGVLLSSDGKPLSDVRVNLALKFFQNEMGSQSLPGPAMVTGEDGVFEFESVPVSYVYLNYRGEHILPGSFEFPEGRIDEHHEIRALRRLHFRIELASPDDVRHAYVLDAQGERLQVNRFEANGMSAFPFVQFEDGKSEVLSVSELATQVVLMAGDEELSRHEIRLGSEGVTVLDL